MAKAKRMYGCTECGATFPKWAGQCGECGAWNTLTETMIESGGAKFVRDRDMLAGAVNFLLNNEVARQEMISAGAQTTARRSMSQ